MIKEESYKKDKNSDIKGNKGNIKDNIKGNIKDNIKGKRKGKNKHKLEEKVLQLLIHDIFSNSSLNDGDIEENIDELIDIVRNQYLQIYDINEFEKEKVYEIENNIENKIEELFNSRLLIEQPSYQVIDIENLTKIIKYLKTIPQPEQRTPEWYTFRNNRLTASDLATAVNKNPYSTRDKLILKKCGHEEPWKPGKAIIHGVKYEDEAIWIYSKRNKVIVKEYGCIPHSKIPFFGASPDGICDYESENKHYIGRMLEIKCPSARPITGFPPEYYYYQVQGQLEVCDLEYCDFLECRIEEYKNKEEFISDSLDKHDEIDIMYRKDGEDKGVVIELYDHILKKMIYKYFRGSTIKEIELWEDEIIDNSLDNESLDYVTTSYWKLTEYCVTLIKRDKEFFNDTYFEIEKFWNDVLHCRENGVNHLIKEKKEKKITSSSSYKSGMSKSKSFSFID